MFDRNSLVTQLGWRLGIVLSVGTLLQMAWLFVHFRGAETTHARVGVFCELFDFFKDVAWTTAAGVLSSCAAFAVKRRWTSTASTRRSNPVLTDATRG